MNSRISIFWQFRNYIGVNFRVFELDLFLSLTKYHNCRDDLQSWKVRWLEVCNSSIICLIIFYMNDVFIKLLIKYSFFSPCISLYFLSVFFSFKINHAIIVIIWRFKIFKHYAFLILAFDKIPGLHQFLILIKTFHWIIWSVNYF